MYPKTANKLIAVKKSARFRDVTEIANFPVKPPNENQVVIKVLHVGINASDINYTAGFYIPNMKFPADTGFEAVGTVVDVGAKVNNCKIGDTAMVSTYGAFTEYLTVSSKLIFPLGQLPPSPQLLTLMVSGLTASIALSEAGGSSSLVSGSTLLVTAAAGGTGLFAVQLGRLAGCHVIGTCSSDEKAEFLKGLGVHRVINYKKEKLGDVLKKEYPKGVDVVYESVGGDTFDACLKNLAVKGKLIVIGMVSGYQDQTAWRSKDASHAPAALSSVLLPRSASVVGFFLNHYTQLWGEHIKKLIQLAQQNKIKLIVDGTPFVGLSSIADAIDLMYSGKNVGKVTVKIDHSPNSSISTSTVKSKL